MVDLAVADRIPVSSLYPDRYGVGRSKVYEYLKALEIQTFKPDGTRFSYLEWADFEALDKYTALLQSEGEEPAATFANQWRQQRGTSTDASNLVPAEVAALPPALQLMIEAIAARLAPVPADPLLPQRQLQEVCDRGWQLSTSQLRAIVGTRPQQESDRYGFEFECVGRMGRQRAWRVKRAS